MYRNTLQNIEKHYEEVATHENNVNLDDNRRIRFILKEIQDDMHQSKALENSLANTLSGSWGGKKRDIYFDNAPEFTDKENFIQWVYEQVSN